MYILTLIIKLIINYSIENYAFIWTILRFCVIMNPVINMELYLANMTTTPAEESDKYISVTSCGTYENVSQFKIVRPEGRLDYQLIYVKDGTMIVTTKKGKSILGAGDIILFRPHEMQDYRSDGDNCASYCYIHFSGTGLGEMLSFFEKDYYSIGEFYEIESFCKSYYEAKWIRESVNDMVFEGKLMTLFGIIADKVNTRYMPSDSEFAKIKKAVYHLNTFYYEKINIDELAEMCNKSKYHFIKIFKNVMGVTPQRYHTLLVVGYGKQMLVDTKMNIGEIAHLLGIDDSLYFSRMFKKNTGMSPNEYRKKYS